MILGLVYSVVRSLLDLLFLCRKSEAALQAEVLALLRRVPCARNTSWPTSNVIRLAIAGLVDRTPRTT
jgi:hypothetical protein